MINLVNWIWSHPYLTEELHDLSNVSEQVEEDRGCSTHDGEDDCL
jgi:hypothetical protein